MDLTFQVTMQNCPLKHLNLFSPPDTFTNGCHFHFGSDSSSFLELFLHSSPVVVAQRIKHLPAMRETLVRSLGWEDPLEKEMTIYSGTLAWKIPWTEEPGSHSPWGHKESDMTERLSHTYILI